MKKLFSTFVMLFMTAVLSAAPIGEQQARRLASDFFAQGATRAAASVELAWAGSALNDQALSRATTDEALLYIYNRSDRKGFVIVAGEEGTTPIVAYSHDRAFEVENMAPGARFILEGWLNELAALRRGSFKAEPLAASRSVGEVVKHYETALWNQDAPYNNEVPVIDGNRAITGCVATALSILCYHHKYPAQSVGTAEAYTYEDPYRQTRSIEAWPLGHRYDYSKMLPDYSAGYTTEQATAVATLMHDIGRSVKMSYHYVESGANGVNAIQGIVDHFGYSKKALILQGDAYRRSEWADRLQENISTYGPTYFSGQSDRGGHAFILDGYTTTDYFHINYGWGGIDNGYYLLPAIEYSGAQDAFFYLEPDPDGESSYQDRMVLSSYYDSQTQTVCRGLWSSVTKFEVGNTFALRLGRIINGGSTDFTGQVGLMLCDKQGTVKQSFGVFSLSAWPSYASGILPTIDVTLTEPLVEGDRLRICYKGAYSSGWQWAQRDTIDVVDELILMASAEEAIEQVAFSYIKPDNQLSLNAPYPIQYTFKRKSDGHVIASGAGAAYEGITIDTSQCAKGEYLLLIASGGDAYTLEVVL